MDELRQEWDRFVDASPQGAVFHKSWWLDAVAPDRWELVTVRRGEELAAGMPLVWDAGASGMLRMAPLTQVLGVLLRASDAREVKRESSEQELALELIDQMPRFRRFAQSFHHRFTNWLPFYWNGFQQTTRYTYVLDGLDEDGVWAGMRGNIRSDVRKAAKQGVTIRDDLGIDALYDSVGLTFQRQGGSTPYSRDYVQRLDEACAAAGVRRILFAVDAEGRIHSAGFFVWDRQSTYYLMGGGDPELRSSGATSLLLWTAIQESIQRGTAFDFEGSMIRGVQRFFQAFGARPRPYFAISRTDSLWWEARDWGKAYARRVIAARRSR